MEPDLKGWNINLEHFPIKKDIWDMGHYALFESKDGKYAFLLYGFVEEGFGKVVSQLAIFVNKQNPNVVFDSNGLKFRQVFSHDFVIAEKSFVIILVCHCYDYQKNINDCIFCLINFKNQKFSMLSFEICDFYCVKEIEAGKLQIALALPDDLARYEKGGNKIFKRFEGVNVFLSELVWKDLSELKNYKSIYCDSPQLFNII